MPTSKFFFQWASLMTIELLRFLTSYMNQHAMKTIGQSKNSKLTTSVTGVQFYRQANGQTDPKNIKASCLKCQIIVYLVTNVSFQCKVYFISFI